MTETCPLCRSPEQLTILRWSAAPTLQNAPASTRAAARGRTVGALEIVACIACGFVFNRAFSSAAIEYAETYDNTQSHSPRFARYMEEIVAELRSRYDLDGKRIVEVGCGKGHFLRMLCRAGSNTGFGFDPTYVGPDSVDDGAITFVREFYSAAHASLHADFVCCRHVLEHVPDPMAMLRAVRMATHADPNVHVFFEVPTIDWILEHECFWDFFYEHCNYFSATTLKFAFEASGFEVLRVRDAFDGQYLWIEARVAQGPSLPAVPDARAATTRIQQFAEGLEGNLARWRDRLRSAAADGGLAIWGAGAKGVTLLSLLDPDATFVKYVVDINPNKQNGFIPVTGHAIVAPAHLRQDPVRHLFITNPNYETEIRATLGELAVVDLEVSCI